MSNLSSDMEGMFQDLKSQDFELQMHEKAASSLLFSKRMVIDVERFEGPEMQTNKPQTGKLKGPVTANIG